MLLLINQQFAPSLTPRQPGEGPAPGPAAALSPRLALKVRGEPREPAGPVQDVKYLPAGLGNSTQPQKQKQDTAGSRLRARHAAAEAVTAQASKQPQISLPPRDNPCERLVWAAGGSPGQQRAAYLAGPQRTARRGERSQLRGRKGKFCVRVLSGANARLLPSLL